MRTFLAYGFDFDHPKRRGVGASQTVAQKEMRSGCFGVHGARFSHGVRGKTSSEAGAITADDPAAPASNQAFAAWTA